MSHYTLKDLDAKLQNLNAIVSGNEMQVDIVSSLPAGTNAIGKLSSNSGVDIGDVDVLTCGTITPGTGATNLGKAEDTTHSSGDVGVMSLAVRNDTISSLVNTDGDYAPLQVNSDGALYVEVVSGGGGGGGGTQYEVGDALGTTPTGTVMIAEDPSGNADALKVNASGELIIDDTALLNELTLIYSNLSGTLAVNDSSTQSILTSINSTLDGVLSVTDNTGNTKLNNIENALDNVNTNLGTLEDDVESTNTKLDTVNTNLGTIETDIESTNTKLDTVNSNINNFRNSFNNFKLVQPPSIRFHRHIGNAWCVNYEFGAVNVGTRLYLNNPIGSDNTYFVYNITFTQNDNETTARARHSIVVVDGEWTTLGTAVDINNLKVYDVINNNSICGHGGSTTNTVKNLEAIYTHATGSSHVSDFQEEMIEIPEGKSIYLYTENVGGNPNCAMSMRFLIINNNNIVVM